MHLLMQPQTPSCLLQSFCYAKRLIVSDVLVSRVAFMQAASPTSWTVVSRHGANDDYIKQFSWRTFLLRLGTAVP